MLGTAEACKHLGVSTRWFRMMRALHGPVEGQQLDTVGAWAFPLASLEAWRKKIGDDGAEDTEDLSVKDAIAQLATSVAQMAGNVFKVSHDTNTSAAKIIETTGAQMLKENQRMGEAIHDSFKLQLELYGLLKELIVGQGQLEADVIKSQADQTIRVERTRVAAKGLKLFAPIVKAGIGKALGAMAIAKDGRAETVLELVRSIKDKPGGLGEFAGVLDQEQLEAVQGIVNYAEGHENLGKSLATLKGRMTQEQKAKLQGMLSDRQLIALASLFEDDDDEGEEAKPEPEKKTA